jgi:predicted lipoprotein with Yx(FWY)xxD motif
VRKTLMIAAAICVSLAFGAQAAEPAGKYPAGIHTKDVTEPPTTVYTVLADAKGMTIYTYDKDVGGKSFCNGECARFWLPVAADAGAKPTGQWSIITREDGSKQWAYKGQPIYTFVKDTRTVDFDGQNQPKDKPVWKFVLLNKKTAQDAAPKDAAKK